MSYIVGFNRKQTALFPRAIDEIIDPENTVRFIDLFVDQLKIVEFGFKDVRKNVHNNLYDVIASSQVIVAWVLLGRPVNPAD